MKKSCAICNVNSEVPTKAQTYFPNGELQQLAKYNQMTLLQRNSK
jgi:hypothetical protein